MHKKLKEPIDTQNGHRLPLVEEFYSIQGEGFHTGKAAYFIRIGGCDIGCYWCDSKYSWDPRRDELIDIKDLVAHAVQYPGQAVVVTGGEPLLYNLDPLCHELKKHQIKTFIETSGAHPLTGIWDWICLSPKRDFPPTTEILNQADELKVIIYEEEDYLWAEENAQKVNSECKLYLQPEWSRYKSIIKPLTDYVKDHPKWNVSLQAHKFMKIP